MLKTRVLIIGVGSIGERHLRCFLSTGRADVSICEINEDLRRDVAERYCVDARFADLVEAIAANPDAAVICAPAHLHVPMALQLVEAGIHPLIEKPLSVDLDDVDRLIDLVEAGNLTAGVAYVLRQNPLLQDVRRAIHSGRFGDPVQIVVCAGQHFPLYRPDYRDIYYKDRTTGGGAVQDALTHLLNAAQWLVGPVSRLAADADHLVLEGVEVEDTVHVVARHGAVMGSYSLNQHQTPNETTLTVVCSHGAARVELTRGRWLSSASPGDDWKVESERSLERDDMFVAQANDFLDAIENGSSTACSLVEGLETLRTNLAVLRAADAHQWQSIPEHEE